MCVCVLQGLGLCLFYEHVGVCACVRVCVFVCIDMHVTALHVYICAKWFYIYIFLFLQNVNGIVGVTQHISVSCCFLLSVTGYTLTVP